MELIEQVGFEEILESVLAEKEMFGFDEYSDKILLVEGVDDIRVINSYYYYKDIEDLPFRVVRAEELDEKVSGKKNALKAFENYKEEFANIICLLDRDFDFFLGEEISDERIFYYDYYELENYLFDETVLKRLAARYFSCNNNTIFEKILLELQEKVPVFLPYMKLGLFRECCYKNPSLKDKVGVDQEGIEKIAKIIRTNPVSILERKKGEFSNLSPSEKIMKFISDELNQIQVNMENIEESILQDEVASTSMGFFEINDLSFFKYGIGGKLILGALQHLMKEDFTSAEFNKAGNLLSLENSLKNDWIPGSSKEFSNLMDVIEMKIS